MGLLSPNDWRANFVGYNSNSTDYEQAIWFRKTFIVHSVPSSALLYVASLGFCEASVNGAAVSNAVLTPSTSFLPKRILYKTYNVTQLLVAGKNTIGLWAAAGWANYPSEDCYNADKKQSPTPLPLVMAELRLDGKAVATDGLWKARQSTISHIGPFGPDNSGYGGDVIDDRLAVFDWNKVTCNEDDWANATVYPLPKVIATGETDFPYALTCSAGNASDPAKPRKISADVMEPTVRHSVVRAASVVSSGGTKPNHTVTMHELFTGWFEVANLQGAPNSTVVFYVSTSKGVLVQYGMQDAFIFGPSGVGHFTMKFSYHEIMYITITGLAKAPAVSDVTGYRLTSDFERTGHFSCSSELITKIYDVTVNNYQGLTTGGHTVDCPHRERRGYGGDGHTSMEFALQNFGVGAYFQKWTRDFADTQSANGKVPHTAPTLSGGGGPAWSGFVITNPWQTYLTYGDTKILEDMYPTMTALLRFYASVMYAMHDDDDDGLLHSWGGSQWDFLGDWVTPHGDEKNVTSPENILFNNCYVHYITTLVGKIAAVLGRRADAAKYQADASALAAAINKAFYHPSSGLYLDALQTHIVMPLATGVVPSALENVSMANLERAITVTSQGHLDTGLTGTYFLTKLLTERNRNDLVFEFANQTTAPGWGFFLAQGYTTWPEKWQGWTEAGLSKMHGCYNSIGLWHIQGIAGIRVDVSDPKYSLQIRAGVDSGDITWANGTRFALTGEVRSAWSLASLSRNNGADVYSPNNKRADDNTPVDILAAPPFSHSVAIPANAVARVMVPTMTQGEDVMEGGKSVRDGAVSGVQVLGMESVNGISFLSMAVGSGSYQFASSWSRSSPRAP